MELNRYTRAAIIVHWLIASLIVFDFVWVLSFDELPQATKQGAVQFHKWTGLTILGLLILRIGWRATHTLPLMPAGMSDAMRRLAALGHLTLYALTALVPISAITFIFLRGGSLDYFGLFSVASPFEPNKPLAGWFKEAHEVLAWALILAAGAHSVVALWHHYVRRDGLLSRMGIGAPRSDTI